VRRNASSELFGNIWHQGTVYPATAKALPELIALFKSPTCIDPDSVAILLASIANGDGYYHVHSQHEKLRATVEEGLRKRGSSIAIEMTKEADYLRVIREMALEFLPLLEPFLDSPNSYTREAVVAAFSRYVGLFPRFKSLLQQRLAIESDEDVKFCIQSALSHQ
jgi:hypothetical protein